jgi:hypothetical protein
MLNLSIRKIKWKDLLFPILSDIEEINKEADANPANNNLELANDDEKYMEVLKEIKQIKKAKHEKENTLAATS